MDALVHGDVAGPELTLGGADWVTVAHVGFLVGLLVVVGPRGAPPETIARFDRVGIAAAELDARTLADALLAGLALARDPACASRCLAAAAEFDWDDAIAPLLESIYGASR